ncbi:MAG: TonB family protein [Acidobacteria bacterium]|nr:TonB family protein [Acidobacteriota bacterium]
MTRTVLLVDFQPGSLSATTELLQRAGFSVVPAGSSDALEALLAGHDVPQLIVIEPVLAGLDGFQLCAQLKRRHGAATIVLASRFLKRQRYRSLAREAGADVFLERPREDEVLVPLLQKCGGAPGEAPAFTETGAASGPLLATKIAAAARVPAAAPDPVDITEALSAFGPVAQVRGDDLDTVIDSMFSSLTGEVPVQRPAASGAAPAPRPATPTDAAATPVATAATPAAAAVAPERASAQRPAQAARPVPPRSASSNLLSILEELENSMPLPATEASHRSAAALAELELEPSRPLTPPPPPEDERSLEQMLDRLSAPAGAAPAQVPAPAPLPVPPPPAARESRAAPARRTAFGPLAITGLLLVAAAVGWWRFGWHKPATEPDPVQGYEMARPQPVPAETVAADEQVVPPEAPPVADGAASGPAAPAPATRPVAPPPAGAVPPRKDGAARAAAATPGVTAPAVAAPVQAAQASPPESVPEATADATGAPADALQESIAPAPAAAGAGAPDAAEQPQVSTETAAPAEAEDATLQEPAAVEVWDEGAQPLRAGATNASTPELIPSSRVEPVYPRMARSARVEARVVLRIAVTTTGQVGRVTVLSEPPGKLGFGEAAVAAVKKWRYTPAMLDGRPIEVSRTVVINFRAR